MQIVNKAEGDVAVKNYEPHQSPNLLYLVFSISA